MRFLVELKRRNVLRMAGLYLVSSWLVVQVAETILPIFGVPDWVLRSLIILLAIGFVLALVFSWVFELTPEGLKREVALEDIYQGPDRRRRATDGSAAMAEPPRPIARRIDRAIIVVLSLAVGLFAVDKFVLQATESAAPEAAAPGKGLIAVLPFRNRSVHPGDDLFVEGIHDDLLTQLAKVAQFKVISRTSMMAYANTELPIPDIASQLGAGLVIEGAVQRAGDRVRVTVQLIDGASDVHLWAETYDRLLNTDTIFAIQADIAQAVANALRVVLSPRQAGALAAGSTGSLPAYEAFLQGKQLARNDLASAERFNEALRQFDRAIELDPNFADAFARKARTQLAIHWFGYGDVAQREAARATVAQARRLAPDSVETLMAEAYLRYWGRRDYAGAEAQLVKVIAIVPDYADAWYTRALVARRDGRFAQAVAYFEHALSIDPANVDIILELSNTLEGMGRYAEVEALYARKASWAKDLSLNRPENYWMRGDLENAWRALDGPNEFFPVLPFRIALASGDPSRIARALSPEFWPENLRSSPEYPELYALAQAESLLESGQPAKEALDAIRARLDQADLPYPAGWAGSGAYNYFPCDLPGMMGDLAGVQAAEKDFFENAPKDAWNEVNVRLALAGAFARAGAPERALDHLEWVIERSGPLVVPSLQATPAFRSLQDAPRYRALVKRYEQARLNPAPG